MKTASLALLGLGLASSSSVAQAAVPDDATFVTLNNGMAMPKASFGLQVVDDDTADALVQLAIADGWRNIFTSVLANNQQGVGAGLAKVLGNASSGVTRGDLFICGSVNSAGACADPAGCKATTTAAVAQNLADLALPYVDMIMLDYPASSCDLIRAQWQAFEDALAANQTRSIAISNFAPDQIDCLLGDTTAPTVTTPALNQMPYSVGHGSDSVVADNAKRGGIIVQAYSPLGSGGLANDPDCMAIGAAHGKSGAQVALRWILQTNATFSANPGSSVQQQYFKEDLALFDFELSAPEMAKLNAK